MCGKLITKIKSALHYYQKQLNKQTNIRTFKISKTANGEYSIELGI